MTIDDVEHYTQEEKDRIVASYPPHEREARAKGIPTMGSGRIFPVEEALISVAPIPIAKHWPQIIGVDFGTDHPFAAARLAWDRDADCVYVTHTYRQRGEHINGEWTGNPAYHATTLRNWGGWIPVAWPHDGLEHDRQSGERLSAIYASHGLNMLPERATHAEGGNGVEAGLADMLERMQTGRFKVFSNNNEWFEEFRLYHRVEGKIVKERDDLMAATRYAVMMLREARVNQTAKIAYPKRKFA
jgi:hypothetical protein